MRSGWLANAAAAARLVADRADLWLPGALSSLAFLGWLPLVLAVVPLPDVSGLTFFGADLATSGSYPWNVVLLSASILFGILTLCLLVAVGEAALQRALRSLQDGRDGDHHGDSLSGETAVTFIVILVALLPAAVATMVLALAVVAVAPGEFQSPDIGGPVLVRVAGAVAPLLVVLLVLVLVGQALGSAAQRRATGPRAEHLGPALAHAAGDVRSRPARVLGTAVVGMAALALLLVLSTLLLRVLWAPIATALGAGELSDPQTVLLLVGFVAIWLCLVLGGGALCAWSSLTWTRVLGVPDRLPEPTTRRSARS